ncbi:TPA: hypothetical protein ACNEJR_003694 [Escherichia coli]
MNVKELDYFDAVRLNEKQGKLVFEAGKGWLEVEGQRVDLNLDNMRCKEVKLSDMNFPEKIQKGSNAFVPEDAVKKGVFALVNMKDEFWLLVFHVYGREALLLRGEPFAKTLDKI